MHFCFVSTRRGSHFMTELLAALSTATAAAGHTTELVFDGFPPLLRDGVVYVVIPHEFRAWGDPKGFPDAQQRARTIALCTENPGTSWFEETHELVGRFAAAVSINRFSAAELQRRGIRCEHVQLGYVPAWDAWCREERVERSIDVLYLGAADPRRDPLLAGLGGELWARRCQFLVPPLEPRTRPRADFLTGTDKYQRLRSAKILLNLHRTTSAALEWMRFLEAICNGCVVVSEPCLDGEPLVAGEHFVAASAEDLASVIDRLLDEPDRLRLIREQAYDFVRTALPMSAAADRLAELAAELPRRPPRAERSGAEAMLRAPAEMHAEQGAPHERQPVTESSPSTSLSAPTERAPRHPLAGIYRRVRARHGPVVRTLGQTEAYAHSAPRVSVLSVLSNVTSAESVEALASVAASVFPELELLVLDDDSGGESASAWRGFLHDHPSLPARLLRQPVNRGLAQSRNTLVEAARGEYLFILDPTGGIYPSTLGQLVASLDADPQAIFAYPMVAVFEEGRPVELLSSLPWEPERLKRGNWIDSMALIRRKRLLELGGYETDPRLAGWEDFDLWCKCAQAGGHGVHLPQVLAWHRRSVRPGSGPNGRGTPTQWALLRERYPALLDSPAEG
jgi:Glycosyl transferase family 2/Glycosyl transferases group 1